MEYLRSQVCSCNFIGHCIEQIHFIIFFNTLQQTITKVESTIKVYFWHVSLKKNQQTQIQTFSGDFQQACGKTHA